MDHLVENNGLSWIAIKIFDQLDNKSLTNARLVKSSWKDLLDSTLIEKRKEIIEMGLIHQKMKNLKKDYSKALFRFYPEWKNIFKDFQERRNLEDVKKLCELVTEFFNSYHHILSQLDPLMAAVELHNDISALELVLPSAKSLKYVNKYGCTILHKATTYGRLEIVKLILTKYPHLIDFEQRDYRSDHRTVLDEAMIQLIFRNTEERNQILRLYQDFEKSYKNQDVKA